MNYQRAYEKQNELISKLCEIIIHVGALDSDVYTVDSIINQLGSVLACNECKKLAGELTQLESMPEMGEKVSDELIVPNERSIEKIADDLIEKVYAGYTSRALRSAMIDSANKVISEIQKLNK